MKKLMTILAACAVAFTTFAVQCAAKTEDGNPCKREAEQNSKYCWQHAKSVGRCQALTQDGDQCKRKAQPGKKYCWQHANYKPAAKAEAKKSAPKSAPKPEAKKPAAKPAAK